MSDYNAETWNALIATLPGVHLLQTWEWGQFKSRWGWTPRYFLNEDCTAATLVLRVAPEKTLDGLGIHQRTAVGLGKSGGVG